MTQNDGWPGLGERIAGAGLGPARVLVNNAGPTGFLATIGLATSTARPSAATGASAAP